MNRKLLGLAWVTGAVFIALQFARPLRVRNLPQEVAKTLPVLARVPQFSLIDSDGHPFTDRDLRGSIWVADFMFASCAGTCPDMARQMRRLQNQLLKGYEVKFVSFTVDPKNDTPEVLRQYARNWDALPQRWHFVTGRKEALHRLAISGFLLSVTETPNDDGPFTHSQKFALIDRQSRIRAYFDGIDSKAMSRLQRAVDQLLSEDSKAGSP